MRTYPKRIRRSLRELVQVAHERAVRKCLSDLSQDFDRWRSGNLNTWELSDRVHRFHCWAIRGIYIQFTRGAPEVLVVESLESGLLVPSDLSAEILDFILSTAVANPQQHRQNSESDIAA